MAHSNLLAALLVPKGSSPKSDAATDDDGEEAPPSSKGGATAEKEYADELAGILGVKDRDRDAFASALHGYVEACMAHAEEEEMAPGEPEDMSESDEGTGTRED